MAEIRENVLALEVKKDGLSQNQDGVWVLKLRVHPADMPIALMMAEMGTRYQAALVELTDDDQVKEQGSKTKKGKDKKGTDLVKQAGALAADPWFAQFLAEAKRVQIAELVPTHGAVTDIPACIRHLTGVKSRKEFGTDPEAAARWKALHSEYVAWKMNV